MSDMSPAAPAAGIYPDQAADRPPEQAGDQPGESRYHDQAVRGFNDWVSQPAGEESAGETPNQDSPDQPFSWQEDGADLPGNSLPDDGFSDNELSGSDLPEGDLLDGGLPDGDLLDGDLPDGDLSDDDFMAGSLVWLDQPGHPADDIPQAPDTPSGSGLDEGDESSADPQADQMEDNGDQDGPADDGEDGDKSGQKPEPPPSENERRERLKEREKYKSNLIQKALRGQLTPGEEKALDQMIEHDMRVSTTSGMSMSPWFPRGTSGGHSGGGQAQQTGLSGWGRDPQSVSRRMDAIQSWNRSLISRSEAIMLEARQRRKGKPSF